MLLKLHHESYLLFWVFGFFLLPIIESMLLSRFAESRKVLLLANLVASIYSPNIPPLWNMSNWHPLATRNHKPWRQRQKITSWLLVDPWLPFQHKEPVIGSCVGCHRFFATFPCITVRCQETMPISCILVSFRRVSKVNTLIHGESPMKFDLSNKRNEDY